MLNAIAELVAEVVWGLLGMLVVGTLIFAVGLPVWGFLFVIGNRLWDDGVRGCASELIGLAVLIGIAWAGFKACGF